MLLSSQEQADIVNGFAWGSDFQPYGLFSVRSESALTFYEQTGQDVSKGIRLRHMASYVTFLESLNPSRLEQQNVSANELSVLSDGLKKLGCYSAEQVCEVIHFPVPEAHALASA